MVYTACCINPYILLSITSIIITVCVSKAQITNIRHSINPIILSLEICHIPTLLHTPPSTTAGGARPSQREPGCNRHSILSQHIVVRQCGEQPQHCRIPSAQCPLCWAFLLCIRLPKREHGEGFHPQH